MITTDRAAAGWSWLGVALLMFLGWPGTSAVAQPPRDFCTKPFPDHVREIICGDGNSRRSELAMNSQIQGVTNVLPDFQVEDFAKEQAQWSKERQKVCGELADNDQSDCYASQAANRASVLQRRVAGALEHGNATFAVGGAKLNARWLVDKETGAISTQLGYGGEVLTEVAGGEKFDDLGRVGDGAVEALVLRSQKTLITFVLVQRKKSVPEIWRYQPSRYWMKKPPVVEIDGSILRLKELPEERPFDHREVASTAIVEWTPSGGWTVAQPFRIKALLPKVQEFDGRARAGETCKTPLENVETVKLGTRTLQTGLKSDDRDNTSGPYALVFGCDLLINIYAGIEFTIARQIDGASVMLSTESNRGNGGFVDRHILADVPGQGVRVWPFPKSEEGPDNDSYAMPTSFGYLFLTPAYPGMDGSVYRWFPDTGYIFDGYRPFVSQQPLPTPEAAEPNTDTISVSGNLLNVEKVYSAFAKAAGPSAIGRAFELSRGGGWSRSRIDRQFGPALLVFADCDGTRLCNHNGGRMIAIYKRATDQFYFTFFQPPDRYSFGGTESPPVWEFHPPKELWPDDAAEAAKILRQGEVVIWK